MNGWPITRGVDLSGSVISRATSTYLESYLESCPESYTRRLGKFRQVRVRLFSERAKTKVTTSREEKLSPVANARGFLPLLASGASQRSRQQESSRERSPTEIVETPTKESFVSQTAPRVEQQENFSSYRCLIKNEAVRLEEMRL